MIDYVNFWLAKAYVDLMIGLGVFGLIVVVFLVLVAIEYFRKL